MKSKKLWILVAILGIVCGIYAIQFRTNLVASEKTSNTKAIEANPDDPNIYRSRGNAHYDRGNYDKAITDFTKAIELNPEDRDAYLWRALAYKRKDDIVKAISDHTKVIEINPKDSSGYLYRGMTYEVLAYTSGGKNHYDKAIADYTKAIELNPDVAPYIYIHRGTLYFNRGSAFATIHDYDLAIIDCTKAIELEPKSAELDPKSAKRYNIRGRAYSIKGQRDKAITDFTKAIELDPKYADAYFYRGLTYCVGIGDYDKAREDIRKAQSLGKKVDPKVLKDIREASQAASYFTLGSHKDDVLKVQGTPDSINRYTALGHEVWRYGFSTVDFSIRNNRVVEWSNYGNLKIKLEPGRNVTTTKAPRQGHISCIVWTEDHRIAMIGTKLVREGDIIDGVTVVKIRMDRIEFEKDGKRWTQKEGDAPDPAWR